MMDALLSRPTLIAFAIAGGVASLAAQGLRRSGRGGWARRLDLAAYAFMGASMLLFIAIGIRGTN